MAGAPGTEVAAKEDQCPRRRGTESRVALPNQRVEQRRGRPGTSRRRRPANPSERHVSVQGSCLACEAVARTGDIDGGRERRERRGPYPYPERPWAGERGKGTGASHVEHEGRLSGRHGGQGCRQRIEPLGAHTPKELERDVQILWPGPGDTAGVDLEPTKQRLDGGAAGTRKRDRHEASEITHATPRDQPGPTLSCCGFLGAAPWRPISRSGRPTR